MKQDEAKAQSSEKAKKIIFLFVVFAVITSIISFTFAWYVDRKTDIGTIQFGAIEIDRTGSFFQTSPITNLIPGESFCSEISFKKSDRSSSYFARLKIQVLKAADNDVVAMDALVSTLNADGPPVLYSSPNYSWIKAGEYYYLVKTSDTNYMYPVANSLPIIFIQDWIYDTSYEQYFNEDGTILQYQKKLEIKVTVQAIQQAFLAEEINTEATGDQGTENIKYTTIAPYFPLLT